MHERKQGRKLDKDFMLISTCMGVPFLLFPFSLFLSTQIQRARQYMLEKEYCCIPLRDVHFFLATYPE